MEKKSYEKPAVIHRELLESVACACLDQDPTNGKTGAGDTCAFTNS